VFVGGGAKRQRPSAAEREEPKGRRVKQITIGVLALQGAFEAHQQRIGELGVATCQVRTPQQLDDIDGLVMPGGESTTMSKLLLTSGLFEQIALRVASGMPVFGTCAGLILLAREVLDGRPDQRSFGAIDISVRRNGYGRQVDSFETDLAIPCLGADAPPFHGVFIRAPKVIHVGPDVTVLAELQGTPVLLQHKSVTVASFHPELSNDRRLHALFINSFSPATSSSTETI
jgi:pyridoxal 5'-phosphate synthase pdxT subunit